MPLADSPPCAAFDQERITRKSGGALFRTNDSGVGEMVSSASRRLAWGRDVPVAIRDGARAGTRHRRRTAVRGGERRHPIAPPSTLLNAERVLEAPKPARGRRGEACHRRRVGRCPGRRAPRPSGRPARRHGHDRCRDARRPRFLYLLLADVVGNPAERALHGRHSRTPFRALRQPDLGRIPAKRVFQTFLPIARANVKAVAESAASISFQTVIQDDLSNLLFPDSDLAKDEI